MGRNVGGFFGERVNNIMEHTIFVALNGSMTMIEGRMPGSRAMWHAAGHMFYVKGSLAGSRFELAGNMVLNYCIERSIPAVAVHRTY